MPKDPEAEMIYTTIGVILMAFIMTAFNKFRVMHEFSSAFWWETFKGFWLRFIVAWPSQYFLIQPIAAKKTAEQAKSKLEYMTLRIRYTVIMSCPLMSVYAMLLMAIPQHWTVAQFFNAWIPGMCINAVFAYFIQFFCFNWLNAALFRLICRRGEKAAVQENN